MAALEDSDEEDPRRLEESVETIEDLEDAKKRITALLQEQQRKQDYHARLQRKLQKLDALLAQRREDVEGLQRTLQLERNKASEQASTDLRERTQKAKMQEERIRDLLSDALFQKPPSSDPQEAADIDTVLVSFIRPNEAVRYNLAFRLDADTTVNQLRDNACKYWGVSTDLFVLKTMGNSKCHGYLKVVDCFKHGEISQMRLEMKQGDNTEVAEAELKAIQPKQGKKRRVAGQGASFNAEGVERIQKFGDNYASYLKKLGGVFFLLKMRDRKPSEHATKIKIHDCLFYFLLAVLTLIVYNMRRPGGRDYWTVQGVHRAFNVTGPLVASDDSYWSEVPRFLDIRAREEVWYWLNTTLPAVVWGQSDRNPLRQYNYLPGYLAIRVQGVKEASCSSANKGLVDTIPGATCSRVSVDVATEKKAEFAGLRQYWEASGNSLNTTGIRGPAKPHQWVSAANREKQKIEYIQGELDTYDGSGYSVEYRMNVLPEDYMAVYVADIAELQKADWIGVSSRAVIVSLTTYNYDYDRWIAIDFLFELLPCGAAYPYMRMLPFKPTAFETDAEITELLIDVVRLLIASYILLFVGFAERKHKTKNHKAGFLYHTSLNGIVDIGMVICLYTAFCIRVLTFSWGTRAYLDIVNDAGGTRGFRSSFGLAQTYNSIFIVDGVLFVFVMFRLLSLFRLSHGVYVLWHTFGIALSPFTFMVGVFLPTFIGFACLLNSVFGASMSTFDGILGTSLQIYNCLVGNLDLNQLLEWDAAWSVYFAVSFYLCVKLLVMSIFAAIVIDAYYIVRITTPPQGEAWTWKRLYTWAVPSLFVNIFQAFTEKRAGGEPS